MTGKIAPARPLGRPALPALESAPARLGRALAPQSARADRARDRGLGGGRAGARGRARRDRAAPGARRSRAPASTPAPPTSPRGTRGRPPASWRRPPRPPARSWPPPPGTTWATRGSARRTSAGAVEAYKQALRATRATPTPSSTWSWPCGNRRSRAPSGGSRGGGGRKGQKPSSQRPGGENPNDQNAKRPQAPGQTPGQNGDQGPQRSQGQDGQRQQPSSQQSGGQSPRFQDQPEMSEQEARALLSAVENLERRHRRDEAAKRAQQKSTQEKDW